MNGAGLARGSHPFAFIRVGQRAGAQTAHPLPADASVRLYGSAFDLPFNGASSADKSSPMYSVSESRTKNMATLLDAKAMVHISDAGVGRNTNVLRFPDRLQSAIQAERTGMHDIAAQRAHKVRRVRRSA